MTDAHWRVSRVAGAVGGTSPCSVQRFPRVSRGIIRLAGAAAVVMSVSAHAHAQSAAQSSAQPPPPAVATLTVFLDCGHECDSDLIRTEVTWVDWVRDRAVADVHVLVTNQSAGAGGNQYTIAFLGNRSMANRGDTLVVTTNPTTTFDERRRAIAQSIALGLVQFAARLPGAVNLQVRHTPASGVAAPRITTANDPWKAWVFQIQLDGSTSGEKSYESREVQTEFSADRVTENWKTNLAYEYNYRLSRATVTDVDSLGADLKSETFTNVLRDWEVQLRQIKSVGAHAGLGTEFNLASQVFRNQRLRYTAEVAAEYNIFPYAEVTRRQLTIRYGLGFSGYRYQDTTIYGHIREVLPVHFAELTYRTSQPWGYANVNMEHRNFLNDASKRSTEVRGGISVRVFQGFSVNMGGSYNWIRDQIYLPLGSQNTVDVLLRRRALATGFEFRLNAGVSYTFGSIFNNVVNPRF